jgi:hypothetical protein
MRDDGECSLLWREKRTNEVMARASAIACGYEDAIDLDRLRHEPLPKVAVGRCRQTGALLASRSTICRLENAPSKTAAGRLSAALLDQFGTTVKPGKLEVLDIEDTFLRGAGRPAACVVERASRRAWLCVDAHLSRGRGTPVAAILRPARTPKGSEVRTVIKHLGTSLYSDFERRGAEAACKFRFHGVGCSSACGVRLCACFRTRHSRTLRRPDVHAQSDKRLPKPSSSSNIGSGSRRGPPQRAGALNAFAATP